MKDGITLDGVLEVFESICINFPMLLKVQLFLRTYIMNSHNLTFWGVKGAEVPLRKVGDE